jgi:hypothetical protein
MWKFKEPQAPFPGIPTADFQIHAFGWYAAKKSFESFVAREIINRLVSLGNPRENFRKIH